MKSLLHKSFRALGFDIVSVRNLDRALEQRERTRQQNLLAEFRLLRSQSSERARPTQGDTIWVSRDQMLSEPIKRMRPAEVVLDIGCAFRPQQYIEAKTHICCEPYSEYMDRLRLETADSSKYVYLNADFRVALDLFPDASVDTVFLVDVIEHIDREIGLLGLDRLKRIARSQVIIFTPLGFMDQDNHEEGVDPWGMGGVEWQKHRSGWQPSDFPGADGWSVIACQDFHINDGYGGQLSKPVGAFWAIWNA